MASSGRYLIAFDMDGTLLRHNISLGDKTKEIVQRLVAEGHILTVATGRPSRVAIPYYRELGMNGPAICYNGCAVFDPDNDSFPARKTMFKREEILDFLTSLGYENFVNIMCENETTIFINKWADELSGFYHPEGMIIKEGNVLELLDSDCFVVIVGLNDHHQDARLVRCAFQYEGVGLRFWGHSEGRFAELYHPWVSKLQGIENAREQVGIDRDHVIVVGDGDNDVEMLAAYPHSIAMINGDDQAKERASTISEFDNEHDGAAIAAEKMIRELSR